MGVDRDVAYVVFVRKYQPRFDAVAAFAGVLIALAFVILVVAFAIVAARGVLALLRTYAWCFEAFVQVYASFPVA